MTAKEMGDIINQLKTQKGIYGKTLCSGICSHAALFRFESGETPTDYLTLKYLLSRLGKSINKVDYMLGNDDFEFLTLHSTINDYLLSDDIDSAEELLDEYRLSKESISPPLEQYFHKIHCVILQKRGLPPTLIATKITAALKITLHNFSLNHVADYLLSEDEWLLLFMLLDQLLKANDADATKHITRVYHIFNHLAFDQEAWIMLYPKIAWLYMKVCNSLDERISLCEDVLFSLRENTRLLHLDAFAKAKCELYKEKYGETRSAYLRHQKQYDALRWIYEDSGKRISEEPEMWFSINNPEIYYLPEVVRSEREALHFSQERAGDKFDIDQKTFSRIETGANRPKPSTLTKIKETLGMYRGIHNTLLVVKDFEDLELESRLTFAITNYNFELAQKLIDELKPKISLKHRENAQYINYTQTTLDYKMGRISPQEALDRCISAFEITRPFDEKTISHVCLSRVESMIIHFIALIHKELGDVEHTLSLLESIIAGFSCSRINPAYHYRELTIILLTLTYTCNVLKEYEKSSFYCLQGLLLQHDYYRCNMLPHFFLQKYFVLELQNISLDKVKDAYKKIHLVEPLLLKERNSLLENHYKSKFNESIFD